MLPRRGGAAEHFVDETLGTNVFHVHFEAGASHQGDVQLRALLRVEAALDAVVYKCHEACCDDDAVNWISKSLGRRKPGVTYSEMSVSDCRI